MSDRQVILTGTAAIFGAFLARAAEEFGSNIFSREETFQRIDTWIEQNRGRVKSAAES
jgi:hypothetical protein